MTGLGPVAAARMTARPVGTDPVSDSASMAGCAASASPVAAPPWTTEKTPGGRPASRSSSPSATAVTGVSSEGLNTTALPAASAGAAFQHAICSG